MTNDQLNVTNALLCKAKALGIPFVIAGLAEKNPQYQQVISENQKGHLHHMWGTLGAMLKEQQPCLLRGPKCSNCSCTIPVDIHLAVTGSPCNPFSSYRTKRFHDGASSHSMYSTTAEDVISFYRQFEPHVGITEQVKGFDMATSKEDPETPMQKPLCSILLTF